MFFGGSPFGHMYQTRNFSRGRGGGFRQRPRGGGEGAGAGQQEGGFNMAAIIQLLPVLFLVFFTLVGNNPSEPVYSLQMKGNFQNRKTTSMKEIDYYVKNNNKFEREYVLSPTLPLSPLPSLSLSL